MSKDSSPKHQKHKERYQRMHVKKYQDLSEEEKQNKKRQHGYERYKNLSEHEKRKLSEY